MHRFYTIKWIDQIRENDKVIIVCLFVLFLSFLVLSCLLVLFSLIVTFSCLQSSKGCDMIYLACFYAPQNSYPSHVLSICRHAVCVVLLIHFVRFIPTHLIHCPRRRSVRPRASLVSHDRSRLDDRLADPIFELLDHTRLPPHTPTAFNSTTLARAR